MMCHARGLFLPRASPFVIHIEVILLTENIFFINSAGCNAHVAETFYIYFYHLCLRCRIYCFPILNPLAELI